VHNKAGDCWLILHRTVYNLTVYALKHPGDSSIFTDLAGTDATMEYIGFHNMFLLDGMQKLVVGVLSVVSDTWKVPCSLFSTSVILSDSQMEVTTSFQIQVYYVKKQRAVTKSLRTLSL